MIPKNRQIYNANFSQEKYNAFLEDTYNAFKHKTGFKIAETPVFIPSELKSKLIEASNEIMEVINQPNFKELTNGAFFDPNTIVPNEDEHPKFIQLDFGICQDADGNLTPKLIELQGFPSLYFYQEFLGSMYRRHFGAAIPSNYAQHLNGYSPIEYIELLRNEIVGDTNPKQVILLEIEPEKQATAIDFYATEAVLGIKILCISKLKKSGKRLFYLDDHGQEVTVLKIYNIEHLLAIKGAARVDHI